MELENGSEIWEIEDRDLRIKQFLDKLAEDVKAISKSNKESYISKVLRVAFEEKNILEGIHE